MKRIALALAMLLALSAAPPDMTAVPTAAAAASGIQLQVRPPGESASAGEIFPVTAELWGNTGFTSVQLTLAFDREKMECTRVTRGTLLEEGAWSSNPDASSGAVAAAASSDPVEGDGVLAVFTFRAKVPLTAEDMAFTVRSLDLYGADGGALSCTIAGARTPGADTSAPDAGPNAQIPDTGENAQIPDTGPKPPEPGGADTPETDTPGTGKTDMPGTGGTDIPETGQTDVPGTGETDTPETETNPPGLPETDGPSFPDTAGCWAEAEIREAVRQGLFHGYPDGTFRPNTPVTRAQFVLVLWNMAGRPAPASGAPFTDTVSLSREFRDAAAWAYGKGYAEGTAPDRFSPAAPLTRQAAMKLLFRYSGGVSGLEAMLGQVYDASFTDSAVLPAWAREGVYWAVYNGILRGTAGKELRPADGLTRAQLAAVIVRYTERFPPP